MAKSTRPPGGKQVLVRVVMLPHGRDLPMPQYQTSGAAGMDLVAAVPADKPIRLKRGQRALIDTGLVLELPVGFEAQVRPRSGLAAKHGVTVLNAPGTIDCDYRGEVKVILVNHGEVAFVVQRGERIAQMVIVPVARAVLKEVSSARATKRGAGGFGSTGVATKSAGSTRKSSERSPKIKRGVTQKKKPTSFPRRKPVASSQFRG